MRKAAHIHHHHTHTVHQKRHLSFLQLPSFSPRIHTIFFACILFLLILLGGKVLWDLGLRLWYELRGPYTWDSPVYWAIGRGILNGFLPYRDLFDIKPPGIFLISAASLSLTGGMLAGSILQVIAIATFPVTFLLSGFFVSMRKNRLQRADVMIFAGILGTVIGLFVAERSGEFQVESFGAFFATLYAVILLFKAEKMRPLWTGLASLCLMCSIGMKEPFFLTALVASFILCRTMKSWIYGFVIPFVIAAALGLLILTLTGYVGPYFTLYLHEIFGHHVGTSDAVFRRGMEYMRVYKDLHAYVFALGPLILFLLGSFLWFRVQHARGRVRKIFVILGTIASFYLTVLAVGVGGEFFNHHYVFAVPAYTALGLAFLRDLIHSRKGSVGFILVMGVIVCTLLSAGFEPRFHYEGRLKNLQNDAIAPKAVAKQIDTILDQCRLSRYLFLGGNGPQPYGYTTHSPLGPIFNQFPTFFEPSQTYFRQQFMNGLLRTQLIVLDALQIGDLAPFTQNYIAANFSKTPWNCVGAKPYTSHYTFYYRTTWDFTK